MRYFLILNCLMILSGLSFAQGPDTVWTRTYGGALNDWGYAVSPTLDGGYIFAGQSNSAGTGGYNVLLVKVTSFGDTLWTRIIGGLDSEGARGIREAATGGYIVVGSTRSYGAGQSDVYVVRTNSFGDTLWTRTFGGADNDYGRAVALTDDGGFVVAGITRSFGAGNNDAYLIRLDSDGDPLWTRTYGTTNAEEAHAVVVTDDGYTLAGSAWRPESQWANALLIHVESDGDTLWTRLYGGAQQDWFNGVDRAPDGGYIAAGQTWSFGAGNSDVYLVRTSSNGETLWERAVGTTLGDEANAVRQTAEGGFIAAGFTTGRGSDVYLVKTDALGDTLWTASYGGTGSDIAWDIAQTSDEQYIIGGETNSFGHGAADFYLIRTGRAPCQAVRDLRIRYSALTTTLYWTAQQRGDYLVYSTILPNHPADPQGPGWTLEATLTDVAAGAQTWSTNSALMPYRNYAIISRCP